MAIDKKGANLSDEDLILIRQVSQDIADLSDYLKSLFDFFPAPTIYITPMGVILEVNKALEDMAKVKKEEIIGKPFAFLFDAKTEKEIMKKTKKKGGFKKQYLFSPKKGRKKIPVSIITKLRVEEDGEPVGLFLTMVDITKIKEAEERLKEENMVLEVRVKARTRRARQMVESLEEIVNEKTKELKGKLRDLQRFYNLTTGREERFKELTQENLMLKSKLEQIRKRVKKYEPAIK